MPIADPIERKEYHARYMREVWYPKNAAKHKAMVNKNRPIRRRRLAKLIADFKIGKKCTRCPETAPECLDFHHQDPTQKEMEVSRLAGTGRSFENILKEIEKCILLCANCHRKLHAAERSSGLTAPS